MNEVSLVKLDVGYLSGATNFNELSISHGCQKDTVKWQKRKRKEKQITTIWRSMPWCWKVGRRVKRLCKTKVCEEIHKGVQLYSFEHGCSFRANNHYSKLIFEDNLVYKLQICLDRSKCSNYSLLLGVLCWVIGCSNRSQLWAEKCLPCKHKD